MKGACAIDAAGQVDLDPRDPDFVADPYPFYARIRETAPVFFWRQYGHWCLARHDDVSAALREPRFGRQILHVATREALGWPAADPRLAEFDAVERHSLLELEPPDHTRLRGLVNRAFVSRRIEHLRPAIAALAHELIDGFEGKGEVDLIASFAKSIPLLMIADLLGAPREATPMLLDWSNRMVAMYQFRRSRGLEDGAVAATRDFVAFLRGILAERRREPRDDLLSALLAVSDLSEPELLSTAILLLNAGHEATVHTIGNGVKAFLEAGADPRAAFATAASARACVEEMLRFDAPLHLFTRYALEDFSWRGIELRQGDKIGLLLGAANRDPARFAEPDRFDPAREPNPHVSFGAGIHFCLGAPLARLELEVALPILFERLPALRLAETPKYQDAYHFRRMERLLVRF